MNLDWIKVLPSKETPFNKEFFEKLSTSILDYAFPVGKTEIFYDAEDHSDYLGFKWERTSMGRFLIGAGTGTDVNNDTRTLTVGQKGGAYRHKLSIDEIPTHNHKQYLDGDSANPAGGGAAYTWKISNQRYSYDGGDLAAYTGNGNFHNNIPPYEVVAYWKRVE